MIITNFIIILPMGMNIFVSYSLVHSFTHPLLTSGRALKDRFKAGARSNTNTSPRAP